MSDLAHWKLHGSVRMVRTELAEWDPSRQEWQPARVTNTASFRPDGQISERAHHNPDGSVVRARHGYDTAGRLVEVHTEFGDGRIHRQLHDYDEAGRLVRTTGTTADGIEDTAGSATCSYDDKGRKTKVERLGTPPPHVAMTYGIEGSELAYGAPGAVAMTTRYDEHDRSTEALLHEAGGNLVRRVLFTRDEHGRVVREESEALELPTAEFREMLESSPVEERQGLMAFMARALTFVSTYDYDGEGRMVGRSLRMGMLQEEHTTFRHDEHGNVIEEIAGEDSREVEAGTGRVRPGSEARSTRHVRFEYRYDDQRNWTERIVWSQPHDGGDFVPANVERRTITYYPA